MKSQMRWLLIVLVVFVWGCAQAPAPASFRDLSFAPLEFQVPEMERLTLDNGMRLYVQEDRELPLVEVTVMIGAGSIGDPADHVGLADLYAAVLRSGGAGPHDPDALDAFLDMRAANLSAAADTYAVTLTLSLRSDDLEEGLEVLADVLRRPRFDAARLEIAQRQALEGIRRQNDDPGTLARRVLSRTLYGEHPLGRSATAESVMGIERHDLVAFHESYVHPNNLWVGISGDFSRDGLLESLARHFGDWPAAAVRPQEIPPLAAETPASAWVVPRGLPQTTILLGEIGIDKDNPDQYALRVMNFLLGGGGFNSRLMREIRSNRGLAYSVYSFYQVGRHLPGLFIAGSETRTNAVLEVVDLKREIMTQMRDTPVAETDLSLARESLINSFVFGFTDPHAVVAMTMRLDFYDYPEDYLRAYRDHIAAVSAADVQRVARRYLNPDRQMLVLVGDVQDTASELAARGMRVEEFSLED
ncbi:M16 family metallopeptidase [Geoalkalibacter halelectricus]|uniref:M16 family metallopeptidase n=1 Tax=Geoalkalibacter halelectricus TaxID=2847045 RepID=UPI003D1D7DA2